MAEGRSRCVAAHIILNAGRDCHGVTDVEPSRHPDAFSYELVAYRNATGMRVGHTTNMSL